MIKDRAKEVLIKMGMPFSVLGLKYIADVIELFEAGHENAKITALYVDVAVKNNTTGSRVERAIRHAFEGVIAKGPRELVVKYLSYDNATNSNLLKLLYYRLKQEESKENQFEAPADLLESDFVTGPDPYQELENDMILVIQRFIKNLREGNANACSKVG